jgi:hypothetical protein
MNKKVGAIPCCTDEVLLVLRSNKDAWAPRAQARNIQNTVQLDSEYCSFAAQRGVLQHIRGAKRTSDSDCRTIAKFNCDVWRNLLLTPIYWERWGGPCF